MLKVSVKSDTPKLRIENLTIDKNCVIIGPSGAGKTTFFRCLLGLHKFEGRVEVDGTEVTRFLGPRRRIAATFQDQRLLPNLTVRQNIEVAGKVNPALLELMRIDQLADRFPNELSGGEAQRVNIVRACCADADIVILDEPMQGIDPIVVRKTLKRLVREMNSQGKQVILVTHELYHTYGIFDQALVLRNGEVVAHDRFEQLYNHPVNPWIANFFGQYTLLNQHDLQLLGLESASSCMVRPEWFRIKKPPFRKDIEPNAEVVSVVWSGSSNRVTVKLRNGKTVTVDLYTDIQLSQGDEVHVSFKKSTHPDWVHDRAGDRHGKRG